MVIIPGFLISVVSPAEGFCLWQAQPALFSNLSNDRRNNRPIVSQHLFYGRWQPIKLSLLLLEIFEGCRPIKGHIAFTSLTISLLLESLFLCGLDFILEPPFSVTLFDEPPSSACSHIVAISVRVNVAIALSLRISDAFPFIREFHHASSSSSPSRSDSENTWPHFKHFQLFSPSSISVSSSQLGHSRSPTALHTPFEWIASHFPVTGLSRSRFRS